MGNTEIENIMIEKFRITKKQAIEIREKMDKYIEEFEENYLYENLYKYLESELKNRYRVNGIGEKNIKDISRKCIRKNNEWNNLEGYYSFLGYILTVIACLAINICDCKPIFSVIMVLGINSELVIFYFFAKYLKNKRKNCT